MNHALRYLNSLGLYRVKPGLERIGGILRVLGDPQDAIPGIIVGGTNGKGSVASGIASVLNAQGYRTGLYTSPHLVRITERIKLDGKEIPPDDFSRLILGIKEAAASIGEEPSYFEVITAAAFLYFQEQGADFSVLEVGMGGRWDATNIISPLLAIITNISKDHTEFLGTSVGEIALEKAGIIKNRVPVITAAEGEALEVVETAAHQKSAPIGIMGKDFQVDGESTENFGYSGQVWNLKNLCFGLPGFYQLENACLVVAAFESLYRFRNVRVEEKHLREGLRSVKWEGRMEILRSSPSMILDGAHNPGAARALRESLEKMFPEEKFVFLISMLRDKDHAGYFSEIAEIIERLVITELPSERGTKAEELSETAGRFIPNITIIRSIEEAFSRVKALSAPVCITGSLYLVGEIKKLNRMHDT